MTVLDTTPTRRNPGEQGCPRVYTEGKTKVPCEMKEHHTGTLHQNISAGIRWRSY